MKSRKRYGDMIFKWILRAAAGLIVLLLVVMVVELFRSSMPSIEKFGWGFLSSSDWSPTKEHFGTLPFIVGTILSSLIAVLIATPISIGIAVYLVEIANKGIRTPLAYLIELLAAIPSVVYGLWGIFVLAPFVREHVNPIFNKLFSFVPFLSGPSYGVGLFTAGLILAIMIIPTISSITREVISVVPNDQREAAWALGATRWEMIKIGVLKYATAGILGAVILGLGRAIGETMAVTMVIGNKAAIPESIFAPAYTMASIIANEFAEAPSGMYSAALIEVGLVLFGVTFLLNMFARGLVWFVTKGERGRT